MVLYSLGLLTPSCLRRSTGEDREPRRLGKRETTPTTLHCRHQNDFCSKTDSDESHLKCYINRDGEKSQLAVHEPQLLKGKERRRWESNSRRPLNSLKPYRWPKPPTLTR